MDKIKILIVDNEKVFADTLKLNLQATGKYNCLIETDSTIAIETINKVKPDLVMIDLMMPKVSGYWICNHLKEHERTKSIPVIVVSGKDDEADKVSCLDMGADDYVVKPFLVHELDARIRAVLRRSTSADRGKIIFYGKTVVIDPLKHEVTVSGEKIELTMAEFMILELLVSNPGRVFTRTDILDHLWGEDKIVVDRTIDVHITHLKHKLGKAARFISNIRGVGYKAEETEQKN